MIIFLLLTIIAAIPGIKFYPYGQLNNGYISKNQTTAINGIFTLFVFWSHVSTYVSLDGRLDLPYTHFKGYMLQAVVITFLFYSGYGMMESIKKKGSAYVKQIPTKRFLRVLVHFDIAVVLYLIVNLVFGKTFPVKRILLSLTGYSAVGNSNWYIFAVLGLYLIVFAAFVISGKNHILGVILTTTFSVGFVFAQMLLKRDTWCYDTIILFPAGMIYSVVKEPAEKLISKHGLIYPALLLVTAAVYIPFFFKRGGGIEFYSMWCILFMALIVLLTMKVRIGNKILEFFGSHVFSIYILQRLPMIVLSKLGFAQLNKYLFVIVCFIITVILAVLFDKLMAKLDGVLFDRKKKS